MKLESQKRHGPLDEARKKAESYIADSKAKNTLRAYTSDWNHFRNWCDHNNVCAAPAEASTVALYISDMAGSFAVSTICRRLTAIRKAHRLADQTDPVHHELVKEVLDGIKRTFGTAQSGVSPLRTKELVSMLDTTDHTTRGVRDRAILLIGFAGAFRRSELVGLDIADVAFVEEGLVIRMRRSKTDQQGQGQLKAIPFGLNKQTCPVEAIREWLSKVGMSSGPVFRPVTKSGTVRHRRLSSKSVALIVKRCALQAGLDPARYAGHSLRSGLATQAAASGVSERAIMKQGGWKSVTMARRYIREGSLFRDNAAGQVGL